MVNSKSNYDLDREIKIINDGIQYWKGFLDALLAVKEELFDHDKQVKYSEEMIVSYKERFRELKTKRKRENARKYKRS
jgi:hypothetical protein